MIRKRDPTLYVWPVRQRSAERRPDGPVSGPVSALLAHQRRPAVLGLHGGAVHRPVPPVVPQPRQTAGRKRQVFTGSRPLLKWYRLRRTIRQDKEHCYFKVPPTAASSSGSPGQGARSPSPAGAAAPPLRKRADPRAPFRPAAGGSPTLGSASGFCCFSRKIPGLAPKPIPVLEKLWYTVLRDCPAAGRIHFEKYKERDP